MACRDRPNLLGKACGVVDIVQSSPSKTSRVNQCMSPTQGSHMVLVNRRLVSMYLDWKACVLVRGNEGYMTLES